MLKPKVRHARVTVDKRGHPQGGLFFLDAWGRSNYVERYSTEDLFLSRRLHPLQPDGSFHRPTVNGYGWGDAKATLLWGLH